MQLSIFNTYNANVCKSMQTTYFVRNCVCPMEIYLCATVRFLRLDLATTNCYYNDLSLALLRLDSLLLLLLSECL